MKTLSILAGIVFTVSVVSLGIQRYGSQNIVPAQSGQVLATNDVVEMEPTVPPSPVPTVSIQKPQTPELSAKSYLVENSDGQDLVNFEADTRLSPASTTKIMTAIVSLQSYNPDKIVTVGKPYEVGATIGLMAGEEISVENLLYGLLLPSGNDAAMALAAAYPEGPDAFVAAMNQEAVDLGLKNTNFVNPSGLDHPDHFSSAHDLAQMARVAMSHPIFRQIVGSRQTVVYSTDKKIKHILVSKNDLLGEAGIIGVKTGYTEIAGEVLVTSVVRNSKEYYLVVMGSSDRFGETEKLIGWLDEYLRLNQGKI